MRGTVTGKVRMPAFEFQRQGPLAKRPAGHKPDFTMSIKRPSAVQTRGLGSNAPTSARRRRNNPLDEMMLVEITKTSDFESVTTLDCAGKKLTSVEVSALRALTSVTKADFSDNIVTMEPFAVMPKLEELDLSCNELKSFDFKASQELTGENRPWASLRTLNLGFNACRKSMTDLSYIPFLTTLNLSNNEISVLPANLMHFTRLVTLNLAANHLNSEAAFESLATIPALEKLNLDRNGITRVPRVGFGFEALKVLSLKGNKIELAEDMEALLEIEVLETVDVCKNPLILRTRHLTSARKLFMGSQITLVTKPGEKRKKQALAGPLRTVAFDPLTLPSFTKGHIKALNKKTVTPRAVPIPKTSTSNADLFITGFESAEDEETSELPPIEIEATPLPLSEDNDDDEIPVVSVWKEVPVTDRESRLALDSKTRNDFEVKFKRLQFLVANPEMRLRPRESTSAETETPREATPQSVLPPQRRAVARQKKPALQQTLEARTEYTKADIQRMLQSMDERLDGVEHALGVVDETGQTAIDQALDQRTFANLHKQYETIRAELVNTLNG